MTRVSGFGNARIRRIARGGKSKLAAIRTTQDQWLAFPRTKDDTQWATLSDVDVVVVASVDPDDPRFARIHVIDADELQSRFDRAYAARRAANHTIPSGRGVWIALYQNEASDPVTLVGAGNQALADTRVVFSAGRTVTYDESTRQHEHESLPASISTPERASATSGACRPERRFVSGSATGG